MDVAVACRRWRAGGGTRAKAAAGTAGGVVGRALEQGWARWREWCAQVVSSKVCARSAIVGGAP